MKEVSIPIGKVIRELRKSEGMTLKQLSEKSGVQLATLCRIETGKMTGTLESHVLIANVFGVELYELYKNISTLPKKVKSTNIGGLG